MLITKIHCQPLLAFTFSTIHSLQVVAPALWALVRPLQLQAPDLPCRCNIKLVQHIDNTSIQQCELQEYVRSSTCLVIRRSDQRTVPLLVRMLQESRRTIKVLMIYMAAISAR